jgi:hypothetical protein
MQRLQAYRFQLKITPAKEKKLAWFAGCRRFVYNRALRLKIEKPLGISMKQEPTVSAAYLVA